jgi:predicted nucleotidyltransferase
MRPTLPPDFPRRELILELAARLAQHPEVERIWLFGSRARRDNFERSDIDFAIEAPGMDRVEWLGLSLDFEDEAPTLLGIDLLRLEEVSDELRRRIQDEGTLLHERTRSRRAHQQPRARSIVWLRGWRFQRMIRLPSTEPSNDSSSPSSCSGR